MVTRALLYIGAIMGGPELADSPFEKPLAKLHRLRGDEVLDTGMSLDVVFQVPGSDVRLVTDLVDRLERATIH